MSVSSDLLSRLSALTQAIYPGEDTLDQECLNTTLDYLANYLYLFHPSLSPADISSALAEVRLVIDRRVR